MKNQTRKNASPVTKRTKNLVIFVIVSLSFALPRNTPARSIAPETAGLPALSHLSLEGVKRVLVVSPHPDDETIATGGVIQAALANDAEVRVVIITNGDGQPFAPVLFGKDGGWLPSGYVSMGESRQAESLSAMETLGLPAENITFLGYPDRGIQAMLKKNWEVADPYTAIFTLATRSPYNTTYQPGAAYCGENLVSNLQALINDYRPDLVVLPSSTDQHSDHAAASAFTSLAIAAVRSANPTYRPALWAYLVHYGKYPELPGVNRSMGFYPPSDLVTANNTWAILTLTDYQVQKKSVAIEDYSTQTLLLGKFLPEFTRSNELFMIMTDNASVSQSNASLPYYFEITEAQ